MSGSADLLSFAVGAGVNFSVHFVGDLYLSDALLLLALPALVLLRGGRALVSGLRTVYILLGTWLLGLVISDAYNHTAILDRLRGTAQITFFGLNILALSILLAPNERRKVLYFIGMALGALASVKLQPSEFAEDYAWKFGYAWGVMLLVLLIASFFYSRRAYLFSALLLLGLCGVNLMMNFRSPILMLMLTLAMVYPIIPEQIGGLRFLPQSPLPRLLLIAILAVVAAAAADASVQFVTKAGYVNESAQEKNVSQQRAGNLLLGGRPEFTIGLRAALDSPIIGHGSWAKDMKYFEMLTDAQVESGELDYERDPENFEGLPLIPGHSHIITAWVWAGIAGVIFWGYMASFCVKGIVRVTMLRPPLAPIYAWSLMSMFWDIFFSPFGASRRTIEAALIVIVAELMKHKVNVVKPAWRRMGARREPLLAMQVRRGSTPAGLR